MRKTTGTSEMNYSTHILNEQENQYNETAIFSQKRSAFDTFQRKS